MLKNVTDHPEVFAKIQRLQHTLAGAGSCGCGGFSGPGDAVGLDLVPDAVKRWCAEKAGEFVWKQYGPAIVLGVGVLAFLAWRGLTCQSR